MNNVVPFQDPRQPARRLCGGPALRDWRVLASIETEAEPLLYLVGRLTGTQDLLPHERLGWYTVIGTDHVLWEHGRLRDEFDRQWLLGDRLPPGPLTSKGLVAVRRRANTDSVFAAVVGDLLADADRAVERLRALISVVPARTDIDDELDRLLADRPPRPPLSTFTPLR